MRLRLVAIAAFSVAVAACSDSSSKKNFSTRGLIAPDARCLVDPRQVGVAERIPDIDEGNGCMVENAWRVRSVAGVAFSQPAVMNCGVVAPLNDWLADSVQPAAQKAFGESVVSVDVAAAYSCRPRNNRSGAKMSEHGFGNAMDISAFTLESGRKVTVEQGFWGSRKEKRFIDEVRKDACGEFSTVLGPGERYHDDHLHIDLARRNSKVCS